MTEEAEGERRQKFYGSTGLKVGAGENTEISLDIGGSLVARTKVLPVVLATPPDLSEVQPYGGVRLRTRPP